MKNNLILTLLFTCFFHFSCDNSKDIANSKKEINKETSLIEDEREQHQRSIDSLNKEISEIKKSVIEKKKEFSSAEIYNIIKKSYLDHVIIGTRDYENSLSFMKEKLGFNIKKGRLHKNGLSNFFIEFGDSSEIEFMSIENERDKLSRNYSELIKLNKYAFLFAIRTKNIIELKESLNNLSADFVEFEENKDYSILSKSFIDQTLPIFFIQYHNNYNLPIADHPNNTEGISSVWIKTKNIKSSILSFIDLGFTAIDTLQIVDFNSKTVRMRNDNFEIILIQSNDDMISGVSIRTKDIYKIKSRLNEKLKLELKVVSDKRGKSIALSPKITKSIWFEFIEN